MPVLGFNSYRGALEVGLGEIQTRQCCSTCQNMWGLCLGAGQVGPVHSTNRHKQKLGLGASWAQLVGNTQCPSNSHPTRKGQVTCGMGVGQAGLGYCTHWQELDWGLPGLRQAATPAAKC